MKLQYEKIKSFDYFIKNLIEKNTNNVPYFHLLIGAGCSISSNLPSGLNLIETLQILTFNIHFNIIKDKYPIKELIIKLKEHILSSPQNKKKLANYIDQLETENKFKINKNKSFHLRSLFGPLNKRELDHYWKLHALYFYNSSLYGFWFEQYSSLPKERQLFIEQLIDQAEPAAGYLILSHLIKNGVFKSIFTTNFDDLINESLLIFSKLKSRVYAHNEIAHFIDYESNRPNIIKLHGDYLFENIKNTISETSKLETLFSQKFINGLDNHGLIVIGYAGNDISIMSNLYKAAKKFKDSNILWCGTDPTNLSLRAVKFINETKNVYYIKIPYFDQLMTCIWAKSKIPIVEEQLSNSVSFTDLKNTMQIVINNTLSKNNLLEDDSIFLVNESKKLELFGTITLTLDPKERIDLLSKSISKYNYQFDYLIRGIAFYENANRYNSKEDIKKSKNDFDNYITQNKNNSRAYYYRACCFYKLNDWDNAVRDYTVAIQLNPSNYLAYNNRGLSNMRLKKYEDAKNDFLVAISQKTDADFYNNLAVNYRNLRKFNDGLIWVNKGISVNPTYSFLYGTKAELYAGLSNSIAFYKNMEKALELGYPVKEFLGEIETIQKYRYDEKFKNLIKKHENNWIR